MDLSALSNFTPSFWGIVVLIGMNGAWLLKEWRETRKLSADDKLARREGYAKQVEMLMTENRKLLADLHILREEYDNHRRLCYAETDQLRGMLLELRGELEGLKRKEALQAIELVKVKGRMNE